MALHPYLDHHGPIAVAHRGGTESAPENTVAAFRAATEVGFRYLETDVHLTADGVLVAFHDDELDRVTDGSGVLAELPWAEVGRARIDGQPIPTLDELLEEFPTARFNIDPKSDHVVVALVSALRRHGALDRVCVGAFSDTRLQRLRTLVGPDLCTAAGPREIVALAGSTRAGTTSATSRVGFQCLQVPVRHLKVEIVTPGFVAAAHARGRPVHVWTIDDPAEMHRLLDLGVDGIMTDRPSVLRAVLEERGSWE